MRWVSKSHAALPWLGICGFFWQVWAWPLWHFVGWRIMLFFWVWKTAGCWKTAWNSDSRSESRVSCGPPHAKMTLHDCCRVEWQCWNASLQSHSGPLHPLTGISLTPKLGLFSDAAFSLSISGLHLYTFKPSLSLGLWQVMCVDSDSERSGVYWIEGLLPKVPRKGCVFECWSDSEPGSPRRSFFLCKLKFLSSSQGTNSGEIPWQNVYMFMTVIPVLEKSRRDSLEHWLSVPMLRIL